MFTFAVLIALGIAIISPLLTALSFAQQKEWRFDRMRVALQEEGVLGILFGKIRLSITAVYVLLFAIPWPSERASVLLALSAFAVLSIAQLSLKRQRLPVFTNKAKMVAVVTIAINIVWAVISVNIPVLLPTVAFVPVIQALLTGFSVLAILPLDTYLKRKIYAQAKVLRDSLEGTTIIGITGSVGKSSCKQFLAHLLSTSDAISTPEFVNSELGICNWFISTLKSRPTAPKVIVLEMGAYTGGEIALMCSIFKPKISIVTHIGTQHLALFGSQEKLLHAKAEILEALPQSGHALFPGDAWYTETLRTKTNAHIHTIGTEDQVDIQITDIHEAADGMHCSIQGRTYHVPVHSEPMLYNAVLAMSAASLCGVEPEEIQTLLPTLTVPKQTFEVKTIGTITLVDDSHNSSPASFKAAIDWAKSHPAEYKVLIAAGLIEQGSQRAAVHQKLGKACDGVFTEVLCTNTKAAKEIEAGFKKPVNLLQTNTLRVPAQALVICEGRIPMQSIQAALENNA